MSGHKRAVMSALFRSDGPGPVFVNRLLTEAIFWMVCDICLGQRNQPGTFGCGPACTGRGRRCAIYGSNEEAINQIRTGKQPDLSVRDKHIRECYVVAEPAQIWKRIEHEIKTMPDYFADHETIGVFIDEEELERNHSAMPHGGYVIRSGRTGGDHVQMVEFRLQLESNPEFTASVMVAYARAAYKLAREGKTGAFTPFRRSFLLPFTEISRTVASRIAVTSKHRQKTDYNKGGGVSGHGLKTSIRNTRPGRRRS